MGVKTQPDGYHTATPYLSMRGAAAAIEFYCRAFGAREVFRLDAGDGLLGHAEIRIGDSVIMLADEVSGSLQQSPAGLGGTSVGLMLYVDDVDACFTRAIAAGGVQLRGVSDQFYGDRSGSLRDPFGHVWTLSTHVEDLSPEQIAARLQALRAAP